MIRSLALALGFVAGGWSLFAVADEAPQVLLYRYVDKTGNVVLDRQGVPAEYAGRGYDVLNAQGRVVRKVPPAVPADQQAALQQQTQDDATDRQLLQRYSTLAALDRDRARQLSDFDGQINRTLAERIGLDQQRDQMQQQAMASERAGQATPPSVLDELKALQDQRAQLDERIAGYQRQRATMAAGFDNDRVRLEQLLKAP